MKSIKQNLQVISKEIKALAKKTEVLMKELAKLEKSQPATKPKTKAVKARVSQKAQLYIKSVLQDGKIFRLSVEGGGCSGFQYGFYQEDNIEEGNDIVCCPCSD